MTSLNQPSTPIINALSEWINKYHAPFYTPGHKGGRGIDRHLNKLLGKQVFQADLPELPGLDNLHNAEGIIAQSQELTAAVFGSEQTWFLINGTTAGIMSAIMTICNDKDKIIVPRNCHRSVIAGIIHSGAIPIYLTPEYSTSWDIAHSITPESLKMALETYVGIKGIVLVYPTYYGVGGDLSSIVAIAHEYNIPVIVDEAHGAHFAFHPDLPPSSLSCGADMVIQSTHKVLGAMTQASMLHVQGNLIDRQRLSQSLQLFQSTSPNYLLLASLDAVQYQMAQSGRELMSNTLNLARLAREELSEIAGLSILTLNDGKTAGFKYLDETRLTVNVTGLGLTGYQADEILNDYLGVTAELPSLKNLTFIISLGNCEADILQLIKGFQKLAIDYRSPDSHHLLPIIPPPDLSINIPSISPRKAFQSKKRSVKLTDAIDSISGETICPYPPGIPLIIAGEIITETVINYLFKLKVEGADFTGNSDPDLEFIAIIDIQ